MSFEIVDASVAILAQHHNPTILHHAFLTSQRIVPADWEPISDECITTPPFSAVKFANGLTITVEPSKLQVLDSQPPADCRDSAAPEIALNYSRALPHVQYTAAGVNFTAFREMNEPHSFTESRFLARGPWNDAPLHLHGIGVTMRFDLEDATLRITVDSGKLTRDSSRVREGILIKGNYHSDLEAEDGEPGLNAAEQAISKFRLRYDHFASVARLLLDEGDGTHD